MANPIGGTVWKIIEDAIATLAAAKTTGTSIGLAILIDLVELAVIAQYIGRLSIGEAYVLEVWEEELIKLVEEAAHDATEDEAQHAREDLQRAQEHPNTVFLFGNFSLFDAALLGGSSFGVVELGIPQSIFAAVADSEILELAAAGLFV